MLHKTADVKFTGDGSILTALIEGEIDHHGAALIRRLIDTKTAEDLPDTLCLDLSGVRFMDSSGLGLILGRYNNTVKLGISFTVRNPSPSAARIISAAGAERIITIGYDEK